MKKSTILLFLLVYNAAFSQIDYKGLVRNLEEITYETNIKSFFKGLKIRKKYGDSGDYLFEDERFLKFHGITVEKVEFSTNWKGDKEISITPFNNIEETQLFIKKLTELYGESKKNRHNNLIWKTDLKTIFLDIENNEKDEFKKINKIEITLYEIKNN